MPVMRIMRRRFWRYALGLMLILSGLFLALDYFMPLPDPERMRSVIVLSDNRTPLRAFADEQGVWRYPADLEAISPLYIDALLTYEDRWFYYHFGINPFSLMRAAWQWVRNGEVISGGSTLTMQVARILDPHARTIPGKARQMFRALQLEWHYSKDEILNFYLNLAPYGGPIEGVQTASYAYLRKPALKLSHAEAALLAVLPQAPSYLRPDRHPERARRYRDKVLRRMHTLGDWSQKTVDDALMEPVSQSALRQPMMAPLFAQRMKGVAQAQAKARLITELDAGLQWTVENVLRTRLGLLPPEASAAVLVMENKTGAVKAYAGSADFFDAQRAGQVDMVQAQRSPGSTLKPFLYGMALDKGLIHEESLLSDAPLSLQGYAPKNFANNYQGAVSVRSALQQSLNVPAVDLLQRLNPNVFDARLRHGGISLSYPTNEQPNLSLILGGAGTSLEQLVQGFSALARGGMSIKPRFTADDERIERRLLSPEASWVIGDILRGLPTPSGFAAGRLNVAWKTGTSYGFRDAWAVGYNQRYTVGVWTGRPDGTPLPGRYGGRASGPILFDVFQALPAPRDSLRRPESVQKQTICWPLGRRLHDTPTQHCHQKKQAWLIDDVAPPTWRNQVHADWSAGLQTYWVNPATGLRVTATCNTPQREKRQVARWPLEVWPWLSEAMKARMRLPDFDKSCPRQVLITHSTDLQIEQFNDSTVLKWPQQGQNLAVDLQAQGGQGEHTWLVDGLPVGQVTAGQALRYQFERPGQYELTVLDSNANADRVQIRVVP